MDLNSGKIFELTEAEREAFDKKVDANIRRQHKKLTPLSEKQHRELKPMGSTQRKGYMRNQPCVCGSGKKFKRCCWSKYT